jgi:hypothetical protein
MLRIIGNQAGLQVSWRLPSGPIKKPLSHTIQPHEGGAEVRLYRGTDLAVYLAPSGAVPPPRPFERATAGTLHCRPLEGKKVEITLRNLRFPTARIPQAGPFEVILDTPTPP